MFETFTLAYTEILNRVRSITTDSDYTALAKSYVNQVHKELLSWKQWPFLQKSGTIVTNPPYTTGTVSWTQNTTTLNGSGTTFTSGHTGWYIQLAGNFELYKVTYVSATQLTTAPAIVSATASAQTFKLFQVSYALPSDFRMPEEVDNCVYFPPMNAVGPREWRRRITRPLFDIPNDWTLLFEASQTALAVPSMAFYPFAKDYYQIQFNYTIEIPNLVNDTDVILIPVNYQGALIDGAMSLFHRDVFGDLNAFNLCNSGMQTTRKQMCLDYGFLDDAPQLVPFSYRKERDGFNDDWSVLQTVWENR